MKRFFSLIMLVISATLIVGCTQKPVSQPPSNTPLSGNTTTGTTLSVTTGNTSGISEGSTGTTQSLTGEEEPINDVLMLISGSKEESCRDQFTAFVTEQIDVNPDAPQEAVINYRDLGLVPKLNHCVLGYSTETMQQFSLIIYNLDTGEPEHTLTCDAEYDVEKDILSPCTNAKRAALIQQYNTIMADFTKHLSQ